MKFNYKVYAVSKLGDLHENGNEYYYADGLSSVENGMCSTSFIKRECTGRKHIFAVASEQNNISRICDIFSDSMSKSDSDKFRIKIQYELRDMMSDIITNQSSGNEESDLSVLYIEGGNVYAAGFGDVNIYRYVKEKNTVEKVVFPLSGLNTDDIENNDDNEPAKSKQPRSKLISPLKDGDAYLILGSDLANSLTDEIISEALMAKDSDVVNSLLQKADSISATPNYSAVCVKIKKSHSKLLYSSIAVALAAILAIVAMYVFSSSDKIPFISKSKTVDTSDNVPTKTDTAIESGSAEVANTAPNVDKTAIYQTPLSTLAEQLVSVSSRIQGDNSKVSYYIKNLISGEVIQSEAVTMQSASMINIFVMAEVFRQVSSGELVMDDVLYSDLSSMITLGDNDAANRLIAQIGSGDAAVGFSRVTAFAESIGCSATKHTSDLQIQSVESVVSGNFTSASDCGLILEKIYKGELVDPDSSLKMLELLKNQHRRGKIPQYLPQTAVIANKTGETDTVQNDAAIVFSPKADYIICIMVNNYTNPMEDAIDVVARMSEVVYNHINN